MQSATVRKYSWREWPQLAPQWAELCDEVGASFFLHPDWVDTWLKTFGGQLDPQILMFSADSKCVAACVLVRSTRWCKVVPLRRVYLNCAGEPEADGTCIEYNRLLCVPGFEHVVSCVLHSYMGTKPWDELVLCGMEPQAGVETLHEGGIAVRKTAHPCWYVDIAALRRQKRSYDSVLSSSRRHHIRQSIRALQEQHGEVKIWSAQTLQEALDALSELAVLHQKTWVRRGKPGVFSSATFCNFHTRLLQQSFPYGRIHMLRVTAGNHPIGLVYGFFLHGRVYAYQAGFADEHDNRVSPGLVTHYVIVNHYLQSRPEVMEYDFMAGGAQYKQSLSNAQRRLEWTTVQQPTCRIRCLAILRNWKARYA